MEYANFGFSSNDGQRTWQADRRPGQSIPVAQWRQDDPGMTPPGDVYGGGSPTGNVFYENGALGPSWAGTFFAADAGRNEVFSYQPTRQGAGFGLERKIFLTSNVKQQYAGLRFRHGRGGDLRAVETLFRPSDIAIGPDGAVYVSDWIDLRVGGHADLDDRLVRRDLPNRAEGLRSTSSEVRRRDDRGADDGAAIAGGQRPGDRLRRAEGARRRGRERRRGDCSPTPAPTSAAEPSTLYHWAEGRQRAGAPESHADPAMRITAYRAMRRADLDVIPVASVSLEIRTPASGARWRCRCAISRPPTALGILTDIARGFDGQDRTYLEALGTGATDKEPALDEGLRRALGVKDDPTTWSGSFAQIAWRLHVPAAVPADRPARDHRSCRSRTGVLAIDTLAFINDPAGVERDDRSSPRRAIRCASRRRGGC